MAVGLLPQCPCQGVWGLLFCPPVRVEPGPQPSVNLYLDQAADYRPRCFRVCFLSVIFVPAVRLPPRWCPWCPRGSAAGRPSLRPAQPRWCCIRAFVLSHPCLFSPSDFLVTIWRLPPHQVAGSQNFTKSPFLSFCSTVVVQRMPALLVGIIKIYFASCRRQAEQNRTGGGWCAWPETDCPPPQDPRDSGHPRRGDKVCCCPLCPTFGAPLGAPTCLLSEVCVCVHACDWKHKGRTGVGICYIVNFLAVCARTVLLFWGTPPLFVLLGAWNF